MLPSIPILENYDISPHTGFLPEQPPLELLPDPYYAKWEAIVKHLQALLLSKRLREVIQDLPVITTSRLRTAAEWRRAYVLLSFMTHAYIWGGDRPEEVRRIPLYPNILPSHLQIQMLTPLTTHPPTTARPALHLHPLHPSMPPPRTPHRSHLQRRLSLELETHLLRRTLRHPLQPLHPRNLHRLPR